MVIPSAIREQLVAHTSEESPNEACGLVLFDGDVAVEYVRGTNAEPSPYRFRLEIDPVVWADLGDTDMQQGIFHSHLSSPPRPSRTDVENIGLWEGKPYLILCLRTGELGLWSIRSGEIEQLPLA